jgi:hypothetical protein
MSALDALRHMGDPPPESGFAHVNRRTRYLSYPLISPAIDGVPVCVDCPKRPLVTGDYIPSYPERLRLRPRGPNIPTIAQLQSVNNPLAIGVAVYLNEMDAPPARGGTTIDPAVIASALSLMTD